MAAVGLLAIPPLIHLLTRRRHRDVPWAAMVFLLAAHQQTKRRLRLEQWLLMVLRVLVLACLGFGMARPALQGAASLVPGGKRIDRVIILDDTLSMQAVRPDGRTAFSAARDVARRLLDGFNRTEWVALATPQRGAITDRPTTDRALLQQMLDELSCGFGDAPLSRAVAAAEEAVRAGGGEPDAVAVYYLTDLAASTWAAAGDVGRATPAADDAGRFARLGAPDGRYVIDVNAADRGNLAITDLTLQGVFAAGGGEATLQVEIATFDIAVREAPRLIVELDEQVIHAAPIELQAERGSQLVSVPVPLKGGGSRALSARLERANDALAADDRRWCAVSLPKALPLLLVCSDAGSPAGQGDAFYLSLALHPQSRAPDADADSLFRPTIVDQRELTALPLADYRAVALLNIDPPSDEALRRLQDFVSEGGGLIIALGARSRAAFGDTRANSAGWLERLAGAQPNARQPVAAGDEPLRLHAPDWSHPILSELAGRTSASLARAIFADYVPIVLLQPQARRILDYTNGDAALLDLSGPRGRVLLWTSSFDMEWNTLAAQPDFVPFMMNLAAYAAGLDSMLQNVTVGSALHDWLAAGDTAAPALLRRPDGRRDPWRTTAEPDATRAATTRRAVRYEQTDLPGLYSTEPPAVASHFAVNTPPAESDLAPTGAAAVKALLGEGVQVLSDPQPETIADASPNRNEMSGALFSALFMLLLAETLLAALFGHHS